MKKYIVALDQGTTSSRAIIFDKKGAVIGSAQYSYKQHFPKPGWVEHDPNDILISQFRALRDAVASSGITPKEIAAIGIANQRETTLCWNKETGEPCGRAIVWQCRRTADICEALINKGYEGKIKELTGLPVDAYFSGTKCKWMLENYEGVAALAKESKLAFGTVDSWLIWNLSGGKLHITDVTNASRTMLFNINTLEYDPWLCEILGVPMDTLPKVVPSGEIYGEVNTDKFLLGEFSGIPICSILGDQQAALFGQKCLSVGDAKNTYGTGCFTLMNIGENHSLRGEGLITTVGWKYKDKTVWALEGSVFNAGSSIQWLRDQLGIIKKASDCDKLAESVSDNGGVYLVSAFSGMGAPHWDMYARGGILGLTRGTTAAHIARATLEGIAYQVYDLVKSMERASGRKISSLKADGGASVSKFMMQFQANLLETTVKTPAVAETTAKGAAFMAGLACGFWKSFEDLPNDGETAKEYTPDMDANEREALIKNWNKAVTRVLGWEDK